MIEAASPRLRWAEVAGEQAIWRAKHLGGPEAPSGDEQRERCSGQREPQAKGPEHGLGMSKERRDMKNAGQLGAVRGQMDQRAAVFHILF